MLWRIAVDPGVLLSLSASSLLLPITLMTSFIIISPLSGLPALFMSSGILVVAHSMVVLPVGAAAG
ncbi:MAG: hypothetical protein HGA99_02770 [Chlorobiaceae bacterium]|nr:hypothetical protein [Chlorobiaceae bacterium]